MTDFIHFIGGKFRKRLLYAQNRHGVEISSRLLEGNSAKNCYMPKTAMHGHFISFIQRKTSFWKPSVTKPMLFVTAVMVMLARACRLLLLILWLGVSRRSSWALRRLFKVSPSDYKSGKGLGLVRKILIKSIFRMARPQNSLRSLYVLAECG